MHSLGLHRLTLDALVSLVTSTYTGTVDTPAHISVVTLDSLELPIILTLWVIDAIIVHKGGLYWLPTN